MNAMLYGTVAALAALLLTAVLARILRPLALRTGLVDRPGGRKVHSRPTPHLGGVAVIAGAVTISVTGYAPLGSVAVTLLWGAGAVALIGFIDDLRPLGALPRLTVEAGAALYVVHGSGLSPAAATLAVGWIVFVTNAFNLLDNSDGAVGTVGAVTALGLSFCAAARGEAGVALVLVALSAALIGFLTLNWHPARIFLGDCGALSTGFLLASAAVLVHTGHEALPSAAGLFALTAVVTADTALVLLSRRRAGRRLLRGGTDHVAHRLRRVGFTVPGAAVVLGAGALVGTVAGVLVHRGTVGPAAVLPLLAALLVALWALLKVPVYGRAARLRPHAQVPSSRPARLPERGGPATRAGAAHEPECRTVIAARRGHSAAPARS
ncbi:MraY family glycosyltransferase [Streptomyces sp. NPDC002851]